eukprot:scaffold171395_cov19-Tisochrysis_lutea.AAC.1
MALALFPMPIHSCATPLSAQRDHFLLAQLVAQLLILHSEIETARYVHTSVQRDHCAMGAPVCSKITVPCVHRITAMCTPVCSETTVPWAHQCAARSLCHVHSSKAFWQSCCLRTQFRWQMNGEVKNV